MESRVHINPGSNTRSRAPSASTVLKCFQSTAGAEKNLPLSVRAPTVFESRFPDATKNIFAFSATPPGLLIWKFCTQEENVVEVLRAQVQTVCLSIFVRISRCLAPRTSWAISSSTARNGESIKILKRKLHVDSFLGPTCGQRENPTRLYGRAVRFLKLSMLNMLLH